MSKRLLTMLVGVAALAMLVAGCGGSDDEESLTKAEYTKQGTAICKETLNDMKVVLKDLLQKEKEEKNRSRNELAGEFVEESMLPAWESQLEELRELSAPSADEVKLEAIYDEMQQGIDQAHQNPEKFFQTRNEPLDESRKEAIAYGLEGCMSVF